MVGTRTIRMLVLATLLTTRSFFLHEPLAAQPQIDVIIHRIELQIQGMKAHLLALRDIVRIHEPAAVGCHLNVREAHVAGDHRICGNLGWRVGSPPEN